MDIIQGSSLWLDSVKKPKRTKEELPKLKKALRKARKEGNKSKIQFCLKAIKEASE